MLYPTILYVQFDDSLPYYVALLSYSSPDDKFLLVCRLNGHSIPDGEEEWLERHKGIIKTLFSRFLYCVVCSVIHILIC